MNRLKTNKRTNQKILNFVFSCIGVLPFLVHASIVLDEGVASVLLQLLQCALCGAKSTSSSSSAGSSGATPSKHKRDRDKDKNEGE